MKIDVQPGRYIIAVSGGVDSIALLHVLQRQPSVELIVAHYDHGIREDSAEDRKLVQRYAKELGLPFVYEEGGLGPNTSEAAARDARYKFLRTVKQSHNANAIVTAHHQDDVIETALLNMVRGTGRKGISSLQSTNDIIRPFLAVSKAEIQQYAKENGLKWREDSTNQEDKYLRNYMRHNVVPKLSASQRQELLERIASMHDINQELDAIFLSQLNLQSSAQKLHRRFFIQLPHAIAKELLAAWLRQNGVREFDKKGLERITAAAKTYAPERSIDIGKRYVILVGKQDLALQPRDR